MSKVFISYSHDDLAWASKLAGALKLSGFDCFFDQNSLRAGQLWETQILNELLACDHMVVLWSGKAQGSDWVSRERARFDALRYRGGQRLAGRLMVHILLDNPRTAYDSDQRIEGILKAGAYSAGAAAVKPDIWQDVVERLSQALGETAFPVTLAIVTVDTKDLKAVDFKFRPPGGRTLDELLGEMGINRSQLASFYGNSREEWHPFGGALSIREILEQVKAQINSTAGAVRIRWVSMAADLFSDNAEAIERASTMLVSGVSLIVLDPIALYSQEVRSLVESYLARCLDNPYAIMMVLPPFPTPPQPKLHRDMVRQVFRSLVDYFYEEPPGPVRLEHAQCSVLTADDADIRRLMRTTLRQFLPDRQNRDDTFLSMRPR
jgi:hypothetical protein